MPGGDVGHPHRGVGGVDRLAARAAGAEDVDLDLVLGDLDRVGALDERDHLDGGEAGLAPPLVVERADPDQPVRPGLDGEVPERIRAP